jgi:hypothetical protein
MNNNIKIIEWRSLANARDDKAFWGHRGGESGQCPLSPPLSSTNIHVIPNEFAGRRMNEESPNK